MTKSTNTQSPNSDNVAVPPANADASQPREGTKGALVVSMLARPSGASIDDLMTATGWLPHTTRAALTGLRKRGFIIDRSSSEEGGSVYRITPVEPPPAKRSRKAVAKAA